MLVLCSVVFSVMVAFALLLPSLMYFLQNAGANEALATQILAGYSLAQFVAGPTLGQLSDKIGRKTVILGGLFLSLFSYFALFKSGSSLTVAAAGLVGAGLSSGIVAVCLAKVTDMTNVEDRSKHIGFIGASIGLAFTIGPAVGAYVASQDAGVATIEKQAALSCLVITVGLLLALRMTGNKQTGAMLQATSGWKDRFLVMRAMSTEPVLLLLCLLMLMFTLALALMEPVMPFLVKDRYEWGPRQMGYLFAYAGLLIVLVQGRLVGPLTRRFGPHRLILAGIIMMAIGLMVIAFAPVPVTVFLGLSLTSFGGAIFNTSIFAVTSKYSEVSRRGLNMGLVQSMQALGRSIGPLAAGSLYLQAQFMPFLLGTLSMMIALVFFKYLIALWAPEWGE